MNIDEMKVSELKELIRLITPATTIQAKQIGSELIGKYVIVRSRNEGINAGYIKELDNTGIVLVDARRLWYHKPADKSMMWYEGVAVSGLADGSKISAKVPLKIIIEDYSITVCTEIATESITGYKANGQN